MISQVIFGVIKNEKGLNNNFYLNLSSSNDHGGEDGSWKWNLNI